jgi:hypothetical protein
LLSSFSVPDKSDGANGTNRNNREETKSQRDFILSTYD